MARTSKKRAQQLKHDKFRDTTMGLIDRAGDRLEGRGRTILYALAAAAAALVLFFAYQWWSGKRADEARLALGKALEVAEAPIVTGTPEPGQTGPSFPSERERAQKAVEEFQKVQQRYGSPYNQLARYFAATNLLVVEREKGLSELEQLSKSGGDDVAARAKFALAQARESDGQLDQAAALYQELLKEQGKHIPAATLNFRLASVYEKQEKKNEAADLLFRLVEESRKAAEAKEDKPDSEPAIIRAAADKLQKLSPERYEKLPPAPTPARRGLGGLGGLPGM